MATSLKFLLGCLIIFASFYFVSYVYADPPSSANYKIPYDSINFGGGAASSDHYTANFTGGEIASGISTSANYYLSAGYQAMDDSDLSVAFSGDPALSPGISAPDGGRADGVVSWTVTSGSGYSLTIKNDFPNFQGYDPLYNVDSGNWIRDYVPASRSLVVDSGAGSVTLTDAGPLDYDWASSTNPTAFGFSATGTNVNFAYKNNGTQCGTGSIASVVHCWDSFRIEPLTDNVATCTYEPLYDPSPCDPIEYNSLDRNNNSTKRTIATTTSGVINDTTTLDLRVEVEAGVTVGSTGVYSMPISVTINAL